MFFFGQDHTRATFDANLRIPGYLGLLFDGFLLFVDQFPGGICNEYVMNM
jgi:hypothetical protein